MFLVYGCCFYSCSASNRTSDVEAFFHCVYFFGIISLILRKLYIKEIKIESLNGSLPFVLVRRLYSAVPSGIEVFLSI